MNRLIPIPDGAIQRGANFFTPSGLDISGMSDPRYLLPGETEWRGPYSVEQISDRYFQYEFDGAVCRARSLAKIGIHAQVQCVGAYIRTHRLIAGPVRKLSDWRQLRIGDAMLMHPKPSADDIERVATRVKYMRDKGCGRYRHWIDADGSLWLARDHSFSLRSEERNISH